MIDATDRRAVVSNPPLLGPAIDSDGAIAPWVRQAMKRAAEAGIDPHRVVLALGIPLHALQGANTAEPADESAR